MNDEHILKTYARYPVTFVKGTGSHLWDNTGKQYIDFASGIGVNSIGHNHPSWVSAVTAAASNLAHVSNLFYTEPGQELATKLCKTANMKKAFFANSGAEANEGLIKLARKYSSDKYDTYGNRYTIVTLVDSFHGRSMGALSATGQDKLHKYFHPFLEGFIHVPANDKDEFEKLESKRNICAVILEPIQGEGGVNPLTIDYVKFVSDMCKKNDWLLLFDEVQTGAGRTGTWWGHQAFDVEPDAISFAKGVGGGVPIGGFMINEKLENVLNAGDHGTTFGGNPLCTSAALATVNELENIIPSVTKKGEYIIEKIKSMNIPIVKDVKGRGLMIGISITKKPSDINLKLLENGLVALTAGTDVIRFLPALNISQEDIDAGLDIFENVLKQ